MKDVNEDLETQTQPWCSTHGRWECSCLDNEETVADNDNNETGLDLSQVESFSQWLDSRGDSLAPADSFDQWLKEREDSIP